MLMIAELLVHAYLLLRNPFVGGLVKIEGLVPLNLGLDWFLLSLEVWVLSLAGFYHLYSHDLDLFLCSCMLTFECVYVLY